MKQNKTLVIYYYAPHYRLPIFKKMANCKQNDYSFLLGDKTDINIKLISHDELQQNGINWKQTNNYWFFNKKILWQTNVISECLLGNYDNIIHLGSPYILTSWLAIIAARLTGKKIYLWTHGIVRNNKRDILKVFYYKIANGLFLYGNWAKNNLIKIGFKPEKLFVIYNSLDHESQLRFRYQISKKKIEETRKKLFFNSDIPILLFIGRLTKRKQLDKLVSATEKLLSNGIKVNLLFVGDGEERENLKSQVYELGIQNNVLFYGEMYSEEILSLLISASDICVSPGDVGLTAMHALMYGTPVITHNNPLYQMPEYEAIQHGETGLLFEHNNDNSLYEALELWLKSHHKNRDLIRQKCFEIIDSYYTPSKQIEIIENALSPQRKHQ